MMSLDYARKSDEREIPEQIDIERFVSLFAFVILNAAMPDDY